MEGVLDGIRVLDFSRVFAGPAATQILGDLGANVVKVEEPAGGDEARRYGLDAAASAAPAVSPSFLALNRNKRSIGIDLRRPAGRALAARLAQASDVVLHNFRPEVMTRWGLDYSDIAALNPRVVYCDFSAYGRGGPLADIGANDVALQAFSGLMSITGEPGGEPVRCGTSVVDLHGGLAMACAVISALYHRQRTGKGQRVGSSLLLSAAHLMNYFYTEYWRDGTVRKPMGSANHLTVPNQAFPTADGRAVIVASTDDAWRRCARVLDADRLDLPEFRMAQDRQRNRGKLVETLSAVTSRLSAAELVGLLSEARVVVAKINSIGEAADSAQLAAAGGVVEFEFEGQTIRAAASPFALDGAPAAAPGPPPRLAEHTDQILNEFGVGRDDVAAYRRSGAFGAAEAAK